MLNVKKQWKNKKVKNYDFNTFCGQVEIVSTGWTVYIFIYHVYFL